MVDELATAIQDILRGRDDLLKDNFSENRTHPLEGHCYVATEALHVALGGTEGPYTPCQVRHEGVSHWFLRHDETGEVLDLTSGQFETSVPYDKGRGRGMQKSPSKRAQDVLECLADRGFEIPTVTA